MDGHPLFRGRGWLSVLASAGNIIFLIVVGPSDRQGIVAKAVETHDEGRKTQCINGISTTIYYKNIPTVTWPKSHSLASTSIFNINL